MLHPIKMVISFIFVYDSSTNTKFENIATMCAHNSTKYENPNAVASSANMPCNGKGPPPQ